MNWKSRRISFTSAHQQNSKKVTLKTYLLKVEQILNQKKIYNDIKEQNEKIKHTKLFCIGSGKWHNYKFTIFLGLRSFAENICNGILSLKAAKIKQRNMKNMIKHYDPNGENTRQKNKNTY